MCRSIMKLFLAGVLLCAVGMSSPGAIAGPFSNLVVFGDSLSDVGNIASATFDIFPGPYYFDDRFSNGPAWVEAFAEGLGLPPVTRSTAGGNNFAYGGARTSGTGGLEGLFIRDVDEQVDQFLDTRIADANALFVVMAGANDLIAGQTNIAIPVNNLADDLERLAGAGARRFLVGNLPLLGHTPRFNGNPSALAQYNARSVSFNAALDTMLDSLIAANPSLTVHRLDVEDLFSQAIENPALFGLTNVLQAAAPGLQPGEDSYDTALIADNADEYLFWDDLHPTATVHAHLAEHALALFALPGDFNRDDMVDAADYVVWQDGLAGGEFEPEDYDLWRANYGRTADNGFALGADGSASAGGRIPEPSIFPLTVAAMAAFHVYRVRRGRSRPQHNVAINSIAALPGSGTEIDCSRISW
jgi:phospholipase/lecithinase/hemolysin